MWCVMGHLCSMQTSRRTRCSSQFELTAIGAEMIRPPREREKWLACWIFDALSSALRPSSLGSRRNERTALGVIHVWCPQNWQFFGSPFEIYVLKIHKIESFFAFFAFAFLDIFNGNFLGWYCTVVGNLTILFGCMHLERIVQYRNLPWNVMSLKLSNFPTLLKISPKKSPWRRLCAPSLRMSCVNVPYHIFFCILPPAEETFPCFAAVIRGNERRRRRRSNAVWRSKPIRHKLYHIYLSFGILSYEVQVAKSPTWPRLLTLHFVNRPRNESR